MNSHKRLPSGTRIEEFEVIRTLGEGGFGITYLARDMSLDRDVALKEYLPRCAQRRSDGSIGPRRGMDDDFARGHKWFVDEGQTLARLDHPGIVRVHRLVNTAQTTCIVMEYVQGCSLAEQLVATGCLSERRVCELLEGIGDALLHVHGENLLHQDVKPANVMLRHPTGRPVLIDFGAARERLGRYSQVVPRCITAGYAPIEQCSEHLTELLGPWTDIYAVGATAFEALTGSRPPAALDRHIGGDHLQSVGAIAQVRLSDGTVAAVDAALSLEIENRPRDIVEFMTLLDGEPGVADESHRPPVWKHTISIGRGDECDVSLHDTSVSRLHARLSFEEGGTVWVEDVGSTNGTFVMQDGAWHRIEQAYLEPEARIRFGRQEVDVAAFGGDFVQTRTRARIRGTTE